MSPPPLDSTTVGMKRSDAKISPLDFSPVGAKVSDPKTLTLPTELSKPKEKAQKQYVPEDPESDPVLSDSSSSRYNLSYDIK